MRRRKGGDGEGPHLRGQEFGCTAERAGPGSEAHAFFAQTEVRDFDVAFRVQQQIVQFQVPGDEKAR